MLLEQKALFTDASRISTYLRTWSTGGDPCVDDWNGATCIDGSVTELCESYKSNHCSVDKIINAVVVPGDVAVVCFYIYINK